MPPPPPLHPGVEVPRRRRARRATRSAAGRGAERPPRPLGFRPRRGPRAVLASLDRRERTGLAAMALCVVVLHVLGWGLLALAAGHHYRISNTELFGFGTGVLAYTLGMRHAFDADHIAAIDNTTRKLVDDGRRPLSVGFFFSLGHSTVVFALAVLLNFGIRSLDAQVGTRGSGLHQVTGVVGTLVSGSFLLLIAVLNLVVLAGIVGVARNLRSGRYDEVELERQLANRGLMNRVFGRHAARIDAPWKMYPVGILFGLGFDTATEIALLVLAGSAVAGGLPFWAVLSLPFLFAAGMSLFDTVDGCFMNFAYDWAFAKPARKVFYNLTVTALSVFVALFIGAVEILGLVGREAGWHGPVFSFFRSFDINKAGFVIVGVFALTWLVALAYWRLAGVEERWSGGPVEALGD